MDTTGGDRQSSTDGEVRPLRDRSIHITVHMHETRIELRSVLVLSIPIGLALLFSSPFGADLAIWSVVFFSFFFTRDK